MISTGAIKRGLVLDGDRSASEGDPLFSDSRFYSLKPGLQIGKRELGLSGRLTIGVCLLNDVLNQGATSNAPGKHLIAPPISTHTLTFENRTPVPKSAGNFTPTFTDEHANHSEV